MCLSRIDNLFKKTNNEKGEMKLTNHARVLNELGNSWITAKVYNEMYMISLLDTKSNSCYIEKSKDYQAFNRPCYKIITRSTLYKLDNYFRNNQCFSVDKKKRPIHLRVLPSESILHLPKEWTIRANVKELLHQLSSIRY